MDLLLFAKKSISLIIYVQLKCAKKGVSSMEFFSLGSMDLQKRTWNFPPTEIQIETKTGWPQNHSDFPMK